MPDEINTGAEALQDLIPKKDQGRIVVKDVKDLKPGDRIEASGGQKVVQEDGTWIHSATGEKGTFLKNKLYYPVSIVKGFKG